MSRQAELERVIADLRRELAQRDELVGVLRAALAQLDESLRALRAELEALRKDPPGGGGPGDFATRLRDAEAQIEQLKRASKRQAAPFSKGSHVADPKKPGRKRGQGQFTRRLAPPDVAERVVVPVSAPACPDCGGSLAPHGTEIVTRTELPPPPAPEVKAYEIALCRCERCGKMVRGRHPEVPPDQRGATAHRLGPRLLGAAHLLHYGMGVPVRRVPAIIALFTGIGVTQGALTQDALRRARGHLGKAYEQLRSNVRTRLAANTDDTGWKVGGKPAYLMAFDTDQERVYQIRAQHRNEEVREIIPQDWDGTLGCDGGASYEAEELQEVRQQKCLSHILRSLSEVMEKQAPSKRTFGERLQKLLREGIDVWHRRALLTEGDYANRYHALDKALTEHLKDRELPDPDDQRLLDTVGGYHDRGNLLRFLIDSGVEPTNNRAERALRPAVIARKVSQCSKNQAGAGASSAFMSVIETLRKRLGSNLLGRLCDVLKSGALPAGP